VKKLAILIGAIALVATACSSDDDATTTTGGADATTTTSADAGGPQSGGVLTVDQGADPTSIDPNRFGSTNDRNIITNMYDTLVEFDLETYEIVSSLATDWSPSADGLVWTFNLREGVTFHDGSTFGAEDVVVSMTRAQDPEAGRTTSLLTRVTETVAIDDTTVEIRLSEPDRILLSTLVDVYVSPSEDIDLSETPVGTGPFKFVSWERNQQVEIERNPEYWQEGLPYLDGVVYRTVPDGTVQSIQIRTGDADMLSDTPLGEIGGLQRAGLQIISPAEGFNSGIYHFHLNTRNEPWTDPAMRVAVSKAVDRAALAGSLFGFMTVLSNPMEINSTFFNADAPSYNVRDLEGAQALVGADRVDGGEMIVCGLGFQYETLAQAVQNQLKEAGIDITITVLDVGTYVARTFGDDTGNFDLSLCAMVPKPDEYDLMNHPYSKLFKEALGWVDENPGFYEELDAARSLASDDEYKASIMALQQQAMEGQPEIVLGGRLSPVTAGAYVHDFIAHTQGHLFLTNVWMDQ
jgi:peptide/nickel transport system substrate-binding protein